MHKTSKSRERLEEVYQERLRLTSLMEARAKTAESRLRALEWRVKITRDLSQLVNN